MRPAISMLIALVLGAAGAETGATLLDNGDFRKFTSGGRVTRWHYSSRFWHAKEGVGVNGSRALIYENSTPLPAGSPNQSFGLTPGRKYVLEADIRIEGTFSGEKGGGAFLKAEWMDAKGTIWGGVTAGPISTTADDWFHLCATSKTVRAGATIGKVEFGVTPGCMGQVVFDNVKFSRFIPPRLLSLECSAKDCAANDGMVEFTAKLDLSGENVAAWKGQFCWRGADGRIHVDVPGKMDGSFARISLNVRDMAFGRSPVVFILVRPNGEIADRKDVAFVRAATVF